MDERPAYPALIDVGYATHVGHVRETNEDTYLAVGPRETRPPLDGAYVLVAVADGMGGHNAGEVASQLAAESLYTALQQHNSRRVQEPLSKRLARAVEWANRAVWDESKADAAREGMGTTLVCALIDSRGQAVLANVGDSRAYLVTERGELQITADHSWVEEQVRAGRMSSEDAQSSPYRHVLSRSLGVMSAVDVDLYEEVELRVGEALVLCTDGVTMYLQPGEIAQVTRKLKSAQAAAERLVQVALERGGADNATVAVVRRLG